MRVLLFTLLLAPLPAYAQCVLNPHPRVVLPACSGSVQCLSGASAHNGYVPVETSVVFKPDPLLTEVKKESGKTPGDSPEDLRLDSYGFIFGVNPTGGGYGTYIKPPDVTVNVSRYGFGDGTQSTIRTDLHRGDYNPTQAGAEWGLGTSTNVTRINNRLIISRYNLANFTGVPFDWMQFDSILLGYGRDWRSNQSMVNGVDSDYCPDQSMDQEVRSEFDFSGEVEEIASLGIPAFRILNWFEYSGEPSSIKQFFVQVDERQRTRLSLYRQGTAPALENEDAGFVSHSWGMRFIPGIPWKYLWRRDSNGNLVADLLQSTDSTRSRLYLTTFRAPDSVLKAGMASGQRPNLPKSPYPPIRGSLVVLGDTSQASTAKGLGIYYPNSPTNLRQSVGIKNGQIIYAEDRRFAAYFLGVADRFQNDTNDFYNIIVRVYTTGLVGPTRTQEDGVREAIRGEFIFLYGTIAQIEAAVAKIEQGAMFR